MRTLTFILVSLFAVNVFASTGGFNCAAQANVGRDNTICGNSAVSNATKLAMNCPAQVKEKSKSVKGVQ